MSAPTKPKTSEYRRGYLTGYKTGREHGEGARIQLEMENKRYQLEAAYSKAWCKCWFWITLLLILAICFVA